MSVRTFKLRSGLQFARECDSFSLLCSKQSFNIWEWCTQKHPNLVTDPQKFTSLESNRTSTSYVKISTLADKQPLQPAVKRSEPNFELQPLRHHCYNHHLKKCFFNNNVNQAIQNNQISTGLDGLLFYEYNSLLYDYLATSRVSVDCNNGIVSSWKRGRKLTEGKCRSHDGPT